MNKRIITSILALQFFFLLVAQDTLLPTVSFGGHTYYTYSAAKGETIYGVAKKFGWDITELCNANPGIEAMLKNKQVVYYPVDVNNETARQFPEGGIKHVVKKGETVFGLSKKYGVTVESIYSLNPKSRQGIRPDEILIIGTQTEAQDNRLKTENVQTDNIVVEEKPISTGILPDSEEDDVLVNTTIVTDIDTESIDIKDKPVNIALILAKDNNKRDIDFSRGVLQALDKFKNSPYRINLSVYSGTPAQIQNVITDSALMACDIMISTYDKNLPSELTSFAMKNKIPLVNTFDLKSDEYISNPQVIQLLPPSEEFNKNIMDFIPSQFADRMFVFCGDDTSDAVGLELKKLISPVDQFSIDSPSQLPLLDISDNSNMVIYSFDTSKRDIEALLNQVTKLKEEFPLSTISIVGRPNWIVYQESMSDKFKLSDTYIPSRFYFDPNGIKESEFTRAYKNLTGFDPVLSFPMYSVMGYDIVCHFVPAIACGDVLRDQTSEETPLQLDFCLKRTSDKSGLLNEVAYILHFSPSGNVDKITLK